MKQLIVSVNKFQTSRRGFCVNLGDVNQSVLVYRLLHRGESLTLQHILSNTTTLLSNTDVFFFSGNIDVCINSVMSPALMRVLKEIGI